MIELPDMPPEIAALPRDERGYPCPWFISWVDGKPEFRCADAKKLFAAIKQKLCWVCGTPLDPKQHVFVVGPMCAINYCTSEPPCHEACAVFAAQACPFLSRPKAVRRDAGLPEDAEYAGFALERNPGVTILWYCRGYKNITDGNGGILFRLPIPAKVKWFCAGRKATRAEIMESIDSGLPILRQMAEQEGLAAMQELSVRTEAAMRLVPKT